MNSVGNNCYYNDDISVFYEIFYEIIYFLCLLCLVAIQ